MKMEFSGKTVLITGAAVGIGRATALRFAQKGAAVVLADIDEKKLAAAKEEVAAFTPEVLALTCDVSNAQQVDCTVKTALARFGKIDILVNNAALWRGDRLFIDTPIELWQTFLNVNLMGTVYFSRAVLPQMIASRWGRIINVASVAGVYGKPQMAAYSATKAAVIALTKALAKETAAYGVTVNSVSPGTVTDSGDPDPHASTPSSLCYMGRTGTDSENANLICFLAGEETAYLSGQNIQLDGCRKII